MSRHRDVRCMNYSDEYDGYDDVYGHSVEDDYCVSPSAEQFLFDRSKQQKIASFITEPDIVEDNEEIDESLAHSNEKKVTLSELEKAKLISCMEAIKNIIGDTVPESDLREKIIKSGFNAEVALDLVLKESSPRTATVAEPVAISKDRVEHYPGKAVISPKSQSTLFTIPKFSFKKGENIEDFNENALLTSDVERLKNLNINSPSTSFPSLADIIANHSKSMSPVVTKPTENDVNIAAFDSLADLTAHHLKNSNMSVEDTKTSEKQISSNMNFVIPKLSIKQGVNNGFSNTQYDKKLQPSLIEIKENDHSMDSFRNSLFNFVPFGNDIKTKLENVEIELQGKITNINRMRTPSPDNWTIDLSTALKEAEFLNSSNSKKKNPQEFTNVCSDITSLQLYTSSTDTELPYSILPTTLDLSSLKKVQLPHIKKHVSPFGKILCRTWKLRKPIIDYQRQKYRYVKPFDFSTPYNRV